MAGYRSPFPFLPDDHMRLVGIIAFHWEAVDLSMQRAIAEVMQHTLDRVSLLTDNLSFRAKQELLMSYARHFQTEDRPVWDEFTRVLELVKKAYALRNAYVHAYWIDGPSPDLPLRPDVHVRGGRFAATQEPTPLSELEDAAQKIAEAGEEFTKFFQSFGMLKP